jgi:hypothetical protein
MNTIPTNSLPTTLDHLHTIRDGGFWDAEMDREGRRDGGKCITIEGFLYGSIREEIFAVTYMSLINC